MAKKYLLSFSTMLISLVGWAQSDEGIPFKQIGKVKAHSSQEIAFNNWAIGGETIDRDLVNFNSWKDYLGPLGAKKIRLQAGWAKCEPEKGRYNFEWLDGIVDYVISQGVDPWLQTSYGNPIYKGGGGIHLSAGIPSSEEALDAWDNWIRAMAKRYKGRVKYWEIWNEPDIGDKVSPEDYARLFIRSAEIIRESIPDARIFALSLAGLSKTNYVDKFLNYMKVHRKLHLIDEITLHGYTYNPDDIYEKYAAIYKIVRTYSDRIQIRQGELGCPSEKQKVYALGNHDWTELKQAKWVVRKMLGDLGRDIPSSYFLIIDIVYTHNLEELMSAPERNTKGLIKSDLKRNFVALKPAYYAYQHVTSVFDHSLERIKSYPYTVNSDIPLSVFAFRSKFSEKQIITIWKDNAIPVDSNETEKMDFGFISGNFTKPVYVDIRTGEVYEIPQAYWNKEGSYNTFKNIPVYDSPILIADKSLIDFK